MTTSAKCPQCKHAVESHTPGVGCNVGWTETSTGCICTTGYFRGKDA